MSKTANIVIISLLLLSLIIYGVIVFDMYIRCWGLFSPYDPPPPDETAIRPGGAPIRLDPETIENRKQVVGKMGTCPNIEPVN